jgi:hypothetical protein
VKLSYAVVWREASGPRHAGRLELGPTALGLEGTGPDGRLWVERLLYEDLSAVRVARGAEARLDGRPALILERRAGGNIHVVSLDGLGIVHELAGRVAELTAGRAAVVHRLVVVVPLRPGARERARLLLEEGPPFDPETTPLERHHVFLTEREAVFLFEGPKARAFVDRLVGDPSVWKAAVAWRRCLGGSPRIAEEAYAWVRMRDPEGASTEPRRERRVTVGRANAPAQNPTPRAEAL